MSATKLTAKRDLLQAEINSLQKQFDERRTDKGHPNLIHFELQALNFRIAEKHEELLNINSEISYIRFKWWLAFVVLFSVIVGLISAYYQNSGV